LRYFLNDANCYGRLVRELTRFVTSCTSPNNPTSHLPSDAELQNQARWVIYDDDDPWNQTAADNAEWLTRFKRDVGLLPASDGPGLPHNESSWRVSGGGSGFAYPANAGVAVKMDAKTFTVSPQTAAQFARSLQGEGRFAPPGTVFCSRELEHGLTELVKASLAQGVVPPDEQLRARAREILKVENTAADEPELLEKFKALHGISLSNLAPLITSGGSGGPLLDYSLPNFTADVEMLANFDLDLGAIDLTTDFSTGVSNAGVDTLVDPLDTLDRVPPLKDYSDSHRVMGATASPLRRRASVRLARDAGLATGPVPSVWNGN
jgi:hypothetical protein